MERSVDGVGRAVMLRAKRILIEGLERRVLFAVGALDSTLGGGGEVITDVNGADNQSTAVAVQADGKIVVAGNTTVGGVNEFAVLRYNINGRLDDGSPTDTTPGDKFGTGGKVLTHLTDYGASATSILIQPDGKIVVGGTETLFYSLLKRTYTDFVVVRYNKDGSLDTSFGAAHTGIVTGGLASAAFLRSASLNAMALQADGKIVAVGESAGDFALERFTAGGLADTTFQGGRVLTHFNFDFGNNPLGLNVAYGVAIAGDGEITVVGSCSNSQAFTLAMARYDATGALDHNFDGDGKLTTNFSKFLGNAIGRDVAIQPDGKIVVACSFNGNTIFGVARFNPSGAFDPTFTDSLGQIPGVSTLSKSITPVGMAIQRNGDIVLAGDQLHFGEGLNFSVYDFTQKGPQASGGLVFDFNGFDSVPAGLAFAADGKIVIAGSTSAGGGGENFAVARLGGFPTAKLSSFSGQVFTDLDGDGVKDSNESPTVDARVYDDINGNGSFDPNEQSALTDLQGIYRIEGQGHSPFAHFYHLRVQLPANTFTQTLPVKNGNYLEVGLPGMTVGNLSFGIQPPKTHSLTTHISGSVFNDLNGNGLRDIVTPTEPNLTGWKVYLDKNKDGKFDAGDVSTLTDGGGNYLFDHLAAGSYRVRLVVQSGYRQTTPGLGYFDLTIKNAQQIINQTFGVTKNILIAGRVVTVESLGDAKITEGLPGWTVYIDADNNGVLVRKETSTLTDGMGNWSFTGLAARSSPYFIRVVPMAGWSRFTPTISVTLTAPGSSKTGLGFAEKTIA